MTIIVLCFRGISYVDPPFAGIVNAGEMLQRLAGVKVQREREQQGTGYWPSLLSRLRARSVSSFSPTSG